LSNEFHVAVALLLCVRDLRRCWTRTQGDIRLAKRRWQSVTCMVNTMQRARQRSEPHLGESLRAYYSNSVLLLRLSHHQAMQQRLLEWANFSRTNERFTLSISLLFALLACLLA
jgi:hypothetical protein